MQLRHRSSSAIFWIDPIWASIQIDLGLLLGDLVIAAHPRQNGLWVCPEPRNEPAGVWDYPQLRFDPAGSSSGRPDGLLFARLKKAYGKKNSKDFLSGGWLDDFVAVLDELGLTFDDYDAPAFSPAIVRRQGDAFSYVHPLATAGKFLIIQFMRRFIPDDLDSYQSEMLMSLGDAIRLDTFPNWTGLNVANIGGLVSDEQER